jgi:hypothetical protein
MKNTEIPGKISNKKVNLRQKMLCTVNTKKNQVINDANELALKKYVCYEFCNHVQLDKETIL